MQQRNRQDWRDRLPKRGSARRQELKRDKRTRKTAYRPVPGRIRINRLPTEAELEAIPHVPVTEFELSDRETARLRYRLYKHNREGRVRYRTLREGSITLVWRIA